MKKISILLSFVLASFYTVAQPYMTATSQAGGNIGSGYSFGVGYEVITRVGPWVPVTINNIGWANLVLADPASWTVTGATSEFDWDFSQVSDTIAPGENTIVYIRFKPLTEGGKCLSISIPNSDPASNRNPFVLIPCGTGSNPDISLERAGEIPMGGSYTFYAVPVGYETYPVDFYIKAHGYSHGITLYNDPKIEKLSGNVDDFVIDESMTQSFIPTYNMTKFAIIFRPLTTGKKSMVVRIPNSDADEGDFYFTVYAKTGNLRGNGRTATVTMDEQHETETLQETQVSVFPNPSKNSFTIWTGGSTHDKVIAQVYGVHGVKMETFQWPGGSHQTVGDDWHPGLYVLVMMTTEGRKVIKLSKEE